MPGWRRRALRPLAGPGGAAPYWTDYEYDKGGNRTKEIRHEAAGDTVRSYEYGNEDGSQPHTLRAVEQTGPDGTSRDEFSYDAAGNMTSRNVGGSPQQLEWDAAGRTSKVTRHDGRESEYIYDADGNRLLKRESGITTLYLDGMELVLQNTTREVTGKRYYTHGDNTVAVRTAGEGVTLLIGDHQGTPNIAVEASSLEASTRRQDPFGGPRGEEPASWPDDKGFVGGTQDDTGLTHLGAREYDPAVGRFISVDPVLDVADPQQMNGYAYGNNSPVTNSDPNGLYYKTVTATKQVLRTTVAVMAVFSLFVPLFKFVTIAYWATVTFTYRVWIEPPFKRWAQAQKQQQQREKQALQDAGMSRAEYEKAQELAADQRSFVEVALSNSWDELKSVLSFDGVRDLVNSCVTDFKLGSCLWNAVTMVGPFKAGKVGKRVWDAINKTMRWSRRRDKARASVNAVKASEQRIKQAQRSCKTNSFVPGTLVLMGDGTTRPIEEVGLGDRVLATNPHTGETTSRKVVVERGFALLTGRWRSLRRLTTSPRRIGNVVKAALVLTHFEHGRLS